MTDVEVIARVKIRPGRLEGFIAQVAEIVRTTRDQDTRTLRCDWFIDRSGTEAEVHEAFTDEDGLVEHKLNTMEATLVLFQEHAYDHQVGIYGTVSQDFIDLVSERMGPPAVHRFVCGLGSPSDPHGRSALAAGAVPALEVIARLKIRPGQLDGFTEQAAELVRLAQELDTQTLRYDWFVTRDGSACEVHEAYASSEGLVEHNEHVLAARAVLFSEHAFDHRMSVYGAISPALRQLGKEHAGGWRELMFLQGLGPVAAVRVQR